MQDRVGLFGYAIGLTCWYILKIEQNCSERQISHSNHFQTERQHDERSQTLPHHVQVHHFTNEKSRTLPRLLRTNQRDNSRQLSALLKLLPLDLLTRIRRRNLAPRLQHAILQSQHLRERVVQEGRGELDAVGARVGEADLEFSRWFLAVYLLRFWGCLFSVGLCVSISIYVV